MAQWEGTMKPRGKGFEEVEKFDWGLYPEAEKILHQHVSSFLKNNSVAQRLSKQMLEKSSTHFFDWIDHMVLPRQYEKKVRSLGFEQVTKESHKTVLQHTKSILFPVLIHDKDEFEISLKPEVLSTFSRIWNHGAKIKGKKNAPYRYAVIKKQGKFLLSAIERRGYNGFIVKEAKDISHYTKAMHICEQRQRKFSSDKQGMLQTLRFIKNGLRTLAPARLTDAFFRGERKYWQSRNKIGTLQKKRQDALGLGWGNHDHHTYRSSRDNFDILIKIFEALGFECRERFYAGHQAGWGAQILEHPECDIVLFSDVDMKQTDRHTDFAHKGFGHAHKLGTVGLWIALHGESILQAGMHHLEGRFDFNHLKKSLSFMQPFSKFPFLKQAFSVGEQWKVERKRVDFLLKHKVITAEQHKEFVTEGSIGSHLENLQRKQGFKGFNQDSVSVIIKLTDPRTQHHRGA